MRLRDFILAVLFVSIFPFAANSADQVPTRLFQRTATGESVAVGGYYRIVDTLRAGTTVQFSDGKTIQLGEFLGEGDTTRIFAVAGDPGQVIRLPKVGTLGNYIDEYARGAAVLEKYEVPSPKVLGGLEGEYLLVERVSKPEFDIGHFLFDGEKLDPLKRLEVQNALVDFVKKTAGVLSVQDAHYKQIVYLELEKKWILLDWRERVAPAFSRGQDGQIRLADPGHFNHGNIVGDAISRWSAQPLLETVNGIVAAERTQMMQNRHQYIEKLATLEKFAENPPWPRVVKRQRSVRRLRELRDRASAHCAIGFRQLIMAIRN